MSDSSLADTLKAALAGPAHAAAPEAAITLEQAAKAAHGLIAKGALDARIAERARLEAIIGSDEAKGRDAMAMHLAFKTEMTAEAAIDLLKVTPKAAATAAQTDAPKSRLDQAMIDFKVASGSAPEPTEASQLEKGLAAAIDQMIAKAS